MKVANMGEKFYCAFCCLPITSRSEFYHSIKHCPRAVLVWCVVKTFPPFSRYDLTSVGGTKTVMNNVATCPFCAFWWRYNAKPRTSIWKMENEREKERQRRSFIIFESAYSAFVWDSCGGEGVHQCLSFKRKGKNRYSYVTNAREQQWDRGVDHLRWTGKPDKGLWNFIDRIKTLSNTVQV